MALIEARGLTKRFNGQTAVNGLDLSVDPREVYGFLGPNGAGKTTTIKMLLGLTKPTAGDAAIGGKKVDLTHLEFRRQIGYLPERIAFYPNLTATQTLSFFCELKRADKAQIPRLLERVGLEEQAKKPVGSYSKGMRQLLGVAQALIGSPPLLVFDEPMEGLDPRWRRAVKDVIVEAQGKGSTVFFSSHILSEVEEVAGRVGILNAGKMVAEDSDSVLRSRLRVKPRLRIRVKGDPKVAGAVAGVVPGVARWWDRGDELYVECDPDAKARVIAALAGAGTDVQDVRSEDPNLEEVFMELTAKGGAS